MAMMYIFRLISARQTQLSIGMKNEKEAACQSRATLVRITSRENRVGGVVILVGNLDCFLIFEYSYV